MNIGILNFGIGNLWSIVQILKKINLNINIYLINKDFKKFEKIEKIVIPGQGSNYSCINNFLNFDLEKLNKIIRKLPVLGICAGKHIFFKKTEEFNSVGINYLGGDIKKFEIYNNSYKIPQIGWNKVLFIKKNHLLNGIKNFSSFYFSHTYYLNFKKSNFIYGLTKYNFYYPTVVIKNNLFLIQFHPEKSLKQGLKIFNNFCSWRI